MFGKSMDMTIYFIDENRKSSLNSQDRTPRFDLEEFTEWLKHIPTIRTMVVSSITKGGGIIGQSVNISMEVNGIPIERKLSDLKSIMSLLRKRYTGITLPQFFDDQEEINTKNMKIQVAQAVQCLASIPFFIEDSDFSDFLYSQGYKGGGFSIKGFRSRTESVENVGLTRWLSFTKYIDELIEKLPLHKDLSKQSIPLPVLTKDEHNEWLNKVNNEELSVSITYEQIEGNVMMCMMSTSPNSVVSRRSIKDFEKYFSFISQCYTSYPIKLLNIEEILKGLGSSNQEYDVICEILTTHMNYLLTIPYVKHHVFTRLFLFLPEISWKAFIYRHDLNYSVKDILKGNILDTIEDMKTNIIDFTGGTEYIDGFDHYCGYLRLLSNEQHRVPDKFKSDLISHQQILYKSIMKIKDMIEPNLSRYSVGIYNLSFQLLCQYCRRQQYTPENSTDKVNIGADLMVLPYIYNKLNDDLEYIKNIINLYEHKEKYSQESELLLNHVTSVITPGRGGTGDSEFTSVTEKLNFITQIIERFDNGILFAYTQFLKIISNSYDQLSNLQKSKHYKDVLPIVHLYEPICKEYRINYVRKLSVDTKTVNLDIYEPTDLTSSVPHRNFENKFELAFYKCYGKVGIVASEYSLNTEYKPSVLVHYPMEIELPYGIEEFCYPLPIKLKTVVNITEANKLLDKNSEYGKHHIFTVTNSHGETNYGCVMMSNEIILDNQKGDMFSYETAQFIISELPIFQIHLNVLHYIINMQTEYMRNKAKEICEKSKDLRSNDNVYLERVSLSAHNVNKIPEPVVAILKQYRKLDYPNSGDKIVVPFLPPEKIIPKRMPKGSTELINSDLMFNYCISEPYVELLSIERLFQTIGCLITDHRLVVISSNTDQLTSTILYIISLFYPFPMSHTINLVLSDNLVEQTHILEGGMGLSIIGINHLKETIDDDGMVILNLDTYEIRIQNHDNTTLRLPFYNKFAPLFSNIMEQIKRTTDKMTHDHLFDEFKKYFRYYMSSLGNLLIELKNNEDEIIKLLDNNCQYETVLGCLDKSNISFMETMLQSSLVNNFSDALSEILEYQTPTKDLTDLMKFSCIQRFEMPSMIKKFYNPSPLIDEILNEIPEEVLQKYPSITDKLNTIMNDPFVLFKKEDFQSDLYQSNYYIDVEMIFSSESPVITKICEYLFYLLQIILNQYPNIMVHLLDSSKFDSNDKTNYKFRFYHLSNNRCDNDSLRVLYTINTFLDHCLSGLYVKIEYNFSKSCNYICDNETIINNDHLINMKNQKDEIDNNSPNKETHSMYLVKCNSHYNKITQSIIISELLTVIQTIQKGITMKIRRMYIELKNGNRLCYEVEFSDNRNWIKSIKRINDIDFEVIELKHKSVRF